jgi:DoxX-like protein
MTEVLIPRTASPGGAKLRLRAGWTLTALFVLFMIFDAGIKLMRMSFVADALAELGFPTDLGFAIGVIEAILLVLYLVPRTSILGAVLFTGLFGGAIAAHLRIGSPLFTHDLFGVYLGLFAWGGLWLRDERLRAVFPIRR